VIGRSASATVDPYGRALTGLADPSSLFGNALGSYITSPLANTSGAYSYSTSPYQYGNPVGVDGIFGPTSPF